MWGAAREDGRLRLCSAQVGGAPVEVALAGLEPGGADGWAAYPAGVAWSLGCERGADLLVDSSVPAGAGLASSAALCCATAAVLVALGGAEPQAAEVARAARRAETDFLSVPVGPMDQLASVHGRAGHALLIDCRSLEVEAVPLDPAAHGLALLVIDTGVRHALADGAYADRRAACERASAALEVAALRDARLEDVVALDDLELRRRARHVVTEDERVLEVAERLRTGDLAGCGPLLNASHASLRDDFEVSCAELDAVVGAAQGAGALGARMTGAGFGGSAIALVEAQRADAVRHAVAAALPGARVFEVEPADGLRRAT